MRITIGFSCGHPMSRTSSILCTRGQQISSMEEQKPQTVWQAANNDIIGISVSNQQLAVTMEYADKVSFQRIDLATAKTERWQLAQSKQHMLINSAHDLSEFLYLTNLLLSQVSSNSLQKSHAKGS